MKRTLSVESIARQKEWKEKALQLARHDVAVLEALEDEDACSDTECPSSYEIIHADTMAQRKNSADLTMKEVKVQPIKDLYKKMEQCREDKSLFYDTATSPDEKLGKCVILNIGAQHRPGSEHDVTDLEDMFKKLNFDVDIDQPEKTRISNTQMRSNLEEIESAIDKLAEIKQKHTQKDNDQEHTLQMIREAQGAIIQLQKEKADKGSSGDELKRIDGEIERYNKNIRLAENSENQEYKRMKDYQTELVPKALDLHDVASKHGEEQLTRKLEAIRHMSNYGEREKYAKYRMFVLIIMAHGDEVCVTDMEQNYLKLSVCYQQLAPENFSAMKGKPKWVIVQKCAGHEISNIDPRPPSSQFGHSSMENPSKIEDQSKERIQPQKNDAADDLCIWLSSFPPYVSMREPNSTWFIRAIIDVVHNHSHHMHLRQMFQRVQEKVRKYSIIRDGGAEPKGGQHPVEICTFVKGKRVYLFPGLSGK